MNEWMTDKIMWWWMNLIHYMDIFFYEFHLWTFMKYEVKLLEIAYCMSYSLILIRESECKNWGGGPKDVLNLATNLATNLVGGGDWGSYGSEICGGSFSQVEVVSFIRRQNLVERGRLKLFARYQIYFLGFSINLVFFLKFWEKIWPKF